MADLFFLLFFLSPGESVCRSSNLTSCTECLKRGPQCAWCFKENFLEGAASNYRCDLAENLLLKGCESEFLEQTETKVEVDTTISSTQVSPQDISVHLGPGSQASVVVAVKQLERYPVDLYSLVDVSASMQENLDHTISFSEQDLTYAAIYFVSNLWLGFGSFVDKPVSPYISVHPSKINNPCSDYEVRCRPAHGFHHVLSMTGNMSEFTRVIKRQRISGNMDTPEGGLDAMLQAVVCQKAVGWRPEAKRLLLFMTDQPSHLALDSRLAGIVIPNDGLCHLEDNIYTASTVMDHPSLGQLSDKLLENHIYSIFAVEKQQYQWYEVRHGTFSYLSFVLSGTAERKSNKRTFQGATRINHTAFFLDLLCQIIYPFPIVCCVASCDSSSGGTSTPFCYLSKRTDKRAKNIQVEVLKYSFKNVLKE
uniref:Integrin beta n=1 Tax=Periophthalmus magnuspinnatus TaxID=409849 RepID=A0A3B4B4J5_9GOBI